MTRTIYSTPVEWYACAGEASWHQQRAGHIYASRIGPYASAEEAKAGACEGDRILGWPRGYRCRPEPIRRVRLAPYRKGMGPSFTLTLWDPGRTMGDGYMRKDRIGYQLVRHENGEREVLFHGDDIGLPPGTCMDSDATVRSVLNWLTLRPGDTDAEYFESYTPRQMEWAGSEAEMLSCYVMDRFGEE